MERQLVSHYLFDDGLVREQPFDLSPLKALIGANLVDLVGCVESTFHQGWPEAETVFGGRIVLQQFEHVRRALAHYDPSRKLRNSLGHSSGSYRLRARDHRTDWSLASGRLDRSRRKGRY